MLVSLPYAANGASPSSAGNAEQGVPVNGQPKGNPKKKGNKAVIVLLAFILGIAAGIVVWLGWQQKQKNDARALVEREEARQEHMDSLMALRNQQEAEERATQQAQAERQSVINFLNESIRTVYLMMAIPTVMPTTYQRSATTSSQALMLMTRRLTA